MLMIFLNSYLKHQETLAINFRNRIVSRMTHVSSRFKNLNVDHEDARQVTRVADIRQVILDI